MKWGIEVSLLLPGGHKTDIVSIDGQLKRFRAMWEGLSTTTQQEYGQQWIDQGDFCHSTQLQIFINQLIKL